MRNAGSARLGDALVKHPYRALIATWACLLVVWDATRDYVDEENVASRPWVNWAALAYVLCAIGYVLVIVPRVIESNSPPQGSGSVAVIRWAGAPGPARQVVWGLARRIDVGRNARSRRVDRSAVRLK